MAPVVRLVAAHHRTYIVGRGLGILGVRQVAVVACALVSQTWFRPGRFLATGDIGPFLRVGLQEEFGHLWNHQSTGAGSSVSLFPQTPEWGILQITNHLGGSPLAAQRLLFAVVIAAQCAGVIAFSSQIIRSRLAQAVAGMLAVFNPFTLTQTPNLLPLITTGLLAAFGYLILGAAKGGKTSPAVFGLFSVVACILFSNPPLLLVTVVWIFTIAIAASAFSDASTRNSLKFLLKCVPWCLALNFWWLLPAAIQLSVGSVGTTYNISSDLTSWAFTHARASVSNVLSLTATWAWPFPEYFPWSARLDSPELGWLRFMLPGLAFVSPLCLERERRRSAYAMLALVVPLVILSKGLHPPYAQLNIFLYEHVPGFILFREPASKFGAPLLVLLASLAAMSVEAAGTTYGAGPLRRTLIAAASLAVLGALLFSRPIWDGTLFPVERPVLPSVHVAVPKMWIGVAAHINHSPQRGKTLVLPLNSYYQVETTWGFYGVDSVARSLIKKPVIQPLPGGYVSERLGFNRHVNEVQEALNSQDLPRARESLLKLGVSHVIVRHDIVVNNSATLGGSPPVISPMRLQGVLSGDPEATSRRFGELVVFTFPGIEMVQLREGSDSKRFSARDGISRDIQWTSPGPARYTVHLPFESGRSALLVLRDSFTRGWTIKGSDGRHIAVDGYANGWVVPLNGATVTLSHRPSEFARIGLLISGVSLLGVVLRWFAGRFGWSRRRLVASGGRRC